MSVAAELIRAHEGKKTNQRMKFDVDLGGKWLATGDEVRDSFIEVGSNHNTFCRLVGFPFSMYLAR